MSTVEYPEVPGLYKSPAFSHVAVIPPSASLVWVGGQNGVGSDGKVVPGGMAAQAQKVKENLEAALAAAGCGWADVVRVQVFLKQGEDVRAGYGAFQAVFAGRKPPLVTAALVASLANPEFLLEVSAEAVKP